jgi:hypothetical protein
VTEEGREGGREGKVGVHLQPVVRYFKVADSVASYNSSWKATVFIGGVEGKTHSWQ